MKRILATILTLLYFASNTGATIHMHYCMGKLVEKNLVHNDDKQCSNCGMDRNEKEDNGCCKDEHKKIQIDQQQQVVDASVFACTSLLLHYCHKYFMIFQLYIFPL